jgi:hypothetical protein
MPFPTDYLPGSGSFPTAPCSARRGRAMFGTVIPGISTISSGVTVRSCTGEYPASAKIRKSRCSNRSRFISKISFLDGICKGGKARRPGCLLAPGPDLQERQRTGNRDNKHDPTMVFVSILTASFREITCFAGQQKSSKSFQDLLLCSPL